MNEYEKYPAAAIIKLANALNGDDDALNWLRSSNFKELAAFHDVFIDANESALEWLKTNDHNEIINFYFALQKNEKAQQLLLKSPTSVWTLTLATVNQEQKAFKILLKNNLKHFGFLAMILNKVYTSYEYRGGYSASSGFGSGFGGGSGGFSGFGGGSFGGGGAGGSW